MIADAVIGAGLGGALRFAPELLAFFDSGRDRAHELRMQYVALEFEKMRQETKRAEIASPDYHASMAQDAASLADTIREQFKATDNPFLNAVSILVRPSTTYALVVLYLIVKLFLCAVAAWHGVSLSDASRLVYSSEDYSLLGGILAFWFADRAMKK